ncbi:MAG: ABC transporter ATP-binding protein [Kiritimatiellae bacterium]|nr:ABC transporter ATP-binding protein [Kiritimatiellia bacterium]
MSCNILEVRDLHVSVIKDKKPLELVRGVSFNIPEGSFYSLVGESGCGKSVTSMSLTQLPPFNQAKLSGEVLFAGKSILNLGSNELRELRGEGGIAYIFQDPISALNPVLRVKNQLLEVYRGPKKSCEYELSKLLQSVGLEKRILNAFPCELSGGMAQRVCIAMAMLSRPRLLIADEPTTALDVIMQQRLLELLSELRVKLGLSILFITHNLGLVAKYSEYAAVMYGGRVVESGKVSEILENPLHPYTQGLLKAVPSIKGTTIAELQTIPGRVPPPGEWEGCAFFERCSSSRDCGFKCQIPNVNMVTQTHFVECNTNLN